MSSTTSSTSAIPGRSDHQLSGRGCVDRAASSDGKAVAEFICNYSLAMFPLGLPRQTALSLNRRSNVVSPVCYSCADYRRHVFLTGWLRTVGLSGPSVFCNPSRIMPPVTIVIPCYNEADRIDVDAYVRYLLQEPNCRLLLVNDGSTDATLEVLQDLSDSNPELCEVLHLAKNVGKAEAVRQGVLHALRGKPRYVGYWDADLATPLSVIEDFHQQMELRTDLRLIMGARVNLLGRAIERQPSRHYLGRLFALAASCTLRLPVYDTQCGAKLLRVTENFDEIFAQPFASRWIFDVEILARLATQVHVDGALPLRTTVYEWPLDEWCDVEGSKVRARDFLRSALDLISIGLRYRKFLAKPQRTVATPVPESLPSERSPQVSKQATLKQSIQQSSDECNTNALKAQLTESVGSSQR